MGLLSKLWEKRGALPLDDAGPWADIGWLNNTASGVTVTPETALKFSAIYAAVRVLAESVASLPFGLYRRLDADGRETASDHRLHDILHSRPNPFMTSLEFRETQMAHLLLRGNAYAEIERDRAGRVIALWPLHSARMEKITRAGDDLIYSYRLPDGTLEHIPGDHIWHLRGLSADGLVGYSPIDLHREAVALGLAAEKFGSSFFGNGAHMSGVLEHPGELGEEALENLRKSWTSTYGGLGNAHRIAILEEGLTYKSISVPPETAQYIATRAFQVKEVARIFRIPPHLLADLSDATFSNIEHMGIEFVQHTLRPWLVRWEQSVALHLLTEQERKQGYYALFNVNALLRGDSAARGSFYSQMFQIGAMSQNDIRRLEDMSPIDDGDEHYVPLNLIPSKTAAAGFYSPAGDDSARGAGRASNLRKHASTLAASKQAEERAIRSARVRERLQQAHERVFADVIGRILRREANDVGNAARRLLGQRSLVDFHQWLEDFYAEHRTFAQAQLEPVARAYMELVAREAMDEIGTEVDEARVLGFVRAWLGQFADRHNAFQLNRLKEILAEESEDLMGAIEREVELWREEERARDEAQNETVSSGNAMAKIVYLAAGMQILRWVSNRGACPYCSALNGRTVAITEAFVAKGMPVHADGQELPLIPSANILHPPLHRKCRCSVVAGF